MAWLFLNKHCRASHELSEEMDQHLAELQQALEQSGLSREDALYAARKQFGNASSLSEQSRDIWGRRILENLLIDFRYVLRQLMRSPAFALSTVLTLAVAIGANTAIFSVVERTLLRPLPFPDSARLLTLWEGEPGSYPWYTFSYPRFCYFQEHSRDFADVAAYDDETVTFTDSAEPIRIEGGRVSANFFSVFGVKPVLGRSFLATDDRHGAPDTVVLSNAFWRTHFQADPKIIGRSVRIDDAEATIIGVLPEGFQFLGEPLAIWRTRMEDTRTFSPASVRLGAQYLTVTARIHSAVSMAQAQARFAAVDAQYKEANRGNSDFKNAVQAKLLQEEMFGPVRTAILLLWAAVFCLLAIACANISSLMLARATARHREVSVRMALGASPWRIGQQVLVECLTLAFCGGLFSFPIAYGIIQPLTPALLPAANSVPEAHFNLSILLFTFGITGLVTLFLASVPLLLHLKQGVHGGLRSGERGFAGSRWATQWRSAIVSGQIALSFALIASAALLAQSFVRMNTLASGIRPDHVMVFSLDLMPASYADWHSRMRFYDDVLRRVQSVSGVTQAAIASKVNFVQSGLSYLVQPEGAPDLGPRNPGTTGSSITPDYFAVMGIPLLSGRSFAERDTAASQRIAIVNQAFARKFFPGQSPIGKHITYSTDHITCEIVGVVGNVRASVNEADAETEIYLPLSQRPWLVAKLLVRTAQPVAIVPVVRKQITAADPSQALSANQPLEMMIARRLSGPRTTMFMVIVFGVAALLLCATGIFGVVAYTVAQRSKEIGVRMALGADGRRVRLLVLGQTFRLLLTGLACGLPLSLVTERLYRNLLFQVNPNDSAVLFGSLLLLSAVALAASYLPARRASRIDPATVLRSE